MKIIDCHTHIFPDAVAEKALAHLAHTSGVDPFHGGKASDLIESMKKSGVFKSVIAPIATKPEQTGSINNYVNKQNKDYFIPLGSIHPDYKEIEKEADRLVQMKIPGVKMHCNYQDFLPQEERLFPLYKALEERNLVLLVHGGFDISFVDNMAPPEGMAIVVEKFTKLKLIVAHLGGWKDYDSVEKYLVGKNVYLDTSYSYPDVSKEVMTRIIKNHGADKVLFGTDSPWKDQKSEIDMINSLDLTAEEKEKILSTNAAKLFPDFV